MPVKPKNNNLSRHIAFPQRMWDWLIDKAHETGNSPSAIIRESVSRRMDNQTETIPDKHKDYKFAELHTTESFRQTEKRLKDAIKNYIDSKEKMDNDNK